MTRPDIPNSFDDMPVGDLELSVRGANCLRKAGVETVRQFLALTKADVLAMKGAGVRTWREVQEVQRQIAPSPEQIRDDLDARARQLCDALNRFLEWNPEYSVRVTASGDVVPSRSLT